MNQYIFLCNTPSQCAKFRPLFDANKFFIISEYEPGMSCNYRCGNCGTDEHLCYHVNTKGKIILKHFGFTLEAPTLKEGFS